MQLLLLTMLERKNIVFYFNVHSHRTIVQQRKFSLMFVDFSLSSSPSFPLFLGVNGPLLYWETEKDSELEVLATPDAGSPCLWGNQV